MFSEHSQEYLLQNCLKKEVKKYDDFFTCTLLGNNKLHSGTGK